VNFDVTSLHCERAHSKCAQRIQGNHNTFILLAVSLVRSFTLY
jgi:hypothetical protein